MPEDTPADPLARIRFDYDVGGFDIADVAAAPLEAVRAWVAAAIEAGEAEPTAMVVATASPDGAPSARTVLLKGIDHGLVFFTNRTSRKGRDSRRTPAAPRSSAGTSSTAR